ncbi:hypothetical protein FJR45_03070 [Sulfurimonas sediminis]|uniref:Uncharacterized protein n=1 Tax=Sulfurimonas sediminis TaxID=2590020 RepID=A0A7M1B0B4_9BACT|nr:hypothetical protein [Sulfurimonas sediminis]QOP42986.1 hypothetical protein FJR45_03070 [Sulfurimonas sediminis]
MDNYFSYDLKSKVYQLFGVSLSLVESIRIIKTIKKVVNYDSETLELYSFNVEDMFYSIELEDYIYNELLCIEDLEYNYENIKEIILAIKLHTDYKIDEIKKYFEELFIEIEQNKKEYELQCELDNHLELEKLLSLQYCAKDIQIFFNDECKELIVRYEIQSYKKIKNVYEKVGVEIIEENYHDLKERLIEYELQTVKDNIQLELNNITKDYNDYGTDEELSQDEKIDALYNTYENISEATTKVITRSGKIKILHKSILHHLNDCIYKLQNDILGAGRYKTELLNMMKKEGLNQIAKNDKGQYHYVNLFKILVNYYDLLREYKAIVNELKWLDDGITAGYEREDKLAYNKAIWYKFYKVAKEKYKQGHLYSVYFSFVYNTKKISFSFLKKAFRTQNTQYKTLNIFQLPISTI